MVRAICGAHAQVAPAAELSIGIRVAGITRDHVRDALRERRSLVRTYGPRGTVHLFPADELGMWLPRRPFTMPDDGHAALTTVALRYLSTYGPATSADFARWLGMLPTPPPPCYHPRPMVFPGAAAERALNRGAAGQVPVLLVDGVVAGRWQHRRSGRRVTVTVEPFAAFGAARLAELDRQVERIGEHHARRTHPDRRPGQRAPAPLTGRTRLASPT